MNVGIKLFDESLALPGYASAGAAAVDLVARIEVEIPPGEVARVPLNIALQLPPQHFALLAARSSLHKKGLMLANGIGIGDYDYRGDNDEYQAALYNFTAKPVTVARGERLVQLLILKRPQIEFEVHKNLESPDRGGFGSTGS